MENNDNNSGTWRSRPCSCSKVESNCHVGSIPEVDARCGTQEMRFGTHKCASFCGQSTMPRSRINQTCSMKPPAQGTDSDHLGMAFHAEPIPPKLSSEADGSRDLQQSDGTRNIFTSLWQDPSSGGSMMSQGASRTVLDLLNAKKSEKPPRESRDFNRNYIRNVEDSCLIRGSQSSSRPGAVYNGDLFPQASVTQQHDSFVETSGNLQLSSHNSSEASSLDQLYAMLRDQKNLQQSQFGASLGQHGNPVRFQNYRNAILPPMSVAPPAATSTSQDTVPRLPGVPYIVKVQSLAGSSPAASTENACDEAVVSSAKVLSKEPPDESSEAIAATGGSPGDQDNQSIIGLQCDTSSAEKSRPTCSVPTANSSQTCEGSESHQNARKEAYKESGIEERPAPPVSLSPPESQLPGTKKQEEKSVDDSHSAAPSQEQTPKMRFPKRKQEVSDLKTS